MSVVIIGAKGQLGLALQDKYPDAVAVDSDELDITDVEAVKNFDWHDVDVVINAAAFTNVDGAETDEGRVAAWNVNAAAPSYLATVAHSHGFTLVHISTDYVFDGSKPDHQETELFSPISVYGASKAAGDIAVATSKKYYILRTSWVIGQGKNFVRTMIELGQKGVNPSVVSDQIGRPTFTGELVKAVDHLLTTSPSYGTYNVTNSGDSVSWAEVARISYKEAGFDNTVTDITTQQYFEDKSGIAPRPLNSTLDLGKIQSTGFTSTDWRDDLKTYISSELVEN